MKTRQINQLTSCSSKLSIVLKYLQSHRLWVSTEVVTGLIYYFNMEVQRLRSVCAHVHMWMHVRVRTHLLNFIHCVLIFNARFFCLSLFFCIVSRSLFILKTVCVCVCVCGRDVIEVAMTTANEDKRGSSTSISQKRYKSFITEGHYAQELKHRTSSGRSCKI